MHKVLGTIVAFFSLIVCWLIGQALSYFIPLPGTLLGLLLLLMALIGMERVPQSLQQASQFCLRHLSLFFIAPLVAAWVYIEQLNAKLGVFLIGILLSTLLSLWLTAWLAQRLFKQVPPNNDKHDPL